MSAYDLRKHCSMVAEINLHDWGNPTESWIASTIYYYGGESHSYWTLWPPRVKMIFFSMKDRILYILNKAHPSQLYQIQILRF